ncbi:hypothetical protein [Ancylobacter rudongensis]|uniref:Uncharacterized protein n=1 Tax=Ancylobacter rudongensis TaxID=177413 RepID=A0A1G4RHL7_9HYPH|nr:hypothetical protein [Ancylobacter rudongensis]SCW56463.1 hypothetical protein SAMN05660859_1666 [Ancylobacter rudongensis]
MQYFSPQQIRELTGITPETLRDWRHRGLLTGFGVVPLENGWTRDLEKIKQLKRPTWLYLRGEVTTLALAKSLTTLRVELSAALHIASLLNLYVIAWLVESYGAYRDMPYAIAWPEEDGHPSPIGIEPGKFGVVRLDDLNRIPAYAGGKALVFDLKKLALDLPEPLRDLLSNEQAS